MNRFLKFITVNSPILVLPVILLAGFFISIENISSFHLCLFKSFFKFDCPGCGLTRAFLSLPKGEIWRAIQFNAASPALYLLFAIMLALLVLKRFNPNFVEPLVLKNLRMTLSQLVLVLLMGHWVVKVWQYFAVHPLFEYLHSLIHQGNLLLLWV